MSGNGSGGGAALAGFIPLTFATPTIMPEPMGSIRDRFVNAFHRMDIGSRPGAVR